MCIKRSYRHVKDPVVRVIVWWITETRRYCMHIRSSVNMYCVSTEKKLVAWRVRWDNAWLTTKSVTFWNRQNQHRSTQQNILGLPTILLHWHHLFVILLFFCCNCFLFFFPLINWRWNQAKSTSYCSLYAHSSHNERWWLFLGQLQQLVELWAAEQS